MENAEKKSLFAIRNVRLFVAFRVLFNARFYYPVFAVMFLDYGLTLSQFAVLNALWAATIVLLEVPSGALADTVGRKNLLVAASALMVFEMALLCFVPLGDSTLIFAVFVINRIFSGAAEAAASGADEAIAYDSLMAEGRSQDWGRVLEWQMRMKSAAYIGAMSIGAAVYDPDLMQTVTSWLGIKVRFTQEMTLRFPVYLTFCVALLTLWSTLRMHETVKPAGEECTADKESCGKTVIEAFRLTLQAGLWILKTPFALLIILFGVTLDHVIRMIITMGSQYYRIIHIPEASFGLIGSGMAVLGLLIPRAARKLSETRSPAFNLGIVTALTWIGLFGMTFFFPYTGIIPVILLHTVMHFLGYFSSHYLNHLTGSEQRATVLSFKGLSLNLAYGCIGIFYSFLFALIRTEAVQTHPGLAEDALKNQVFIQSIQWFPWYFLILAGVVLVFAKQRLKHSTAHKYPIQPGVGNAA